MTHLLKTTFKAFEAGEITRFEGHIVVFVGKDEGLGEQAQTLDDLCGGAIRRAVAHESFTKVKTAQKVSLKHPANLKAEAIHIVKLKETAKDAKARKAGAGLAAAAMNSDLLVLGESGENAPQFAFGMSLRAYEFDRHKSAEDAKSHELTVMSDDPKACMADFEMLHAIAQGVHFTRDLTNEPANILTTVEFASRLEALKEDGLEVEVLEEKDMEALGMGALLGVGMGSETPSKLVIMRWNGGGEEAPLALVGKGVVFDTAGISLKPAGGMEAMTMDMGGAGVVAGVMSALAGRKAKANVIGMVGLVENMPDGRAQRPGDVVTSMKGDTIEVINTDAEGRLVLCDALWYCQERFKPSGIIDLATLTGAAIIALGHENAAVFSNKNGFANKFLKSAKREGEGAWRLPLGQGYDDQLKSRVADMMNVGGRPAGSITAAQFLARFVKKETPWIHLDIAGVASLSADTDLAPKGATGWGVRAINRMISDYYEVS